jgi:hypothetical protein
MKTNDLANWLLEDNSIEAGKYIKEESAKEAPTENVKQFIKNHIDDASFVQYLEKNKIIEAFSIASFDVGVGDKVAKMCNDSAKNKDMYAVSIGNDSDNLIMIAWTKKKISKKSELIEYVYDLYEKGNLPKFDEFVKYKKEN